MKRMQFLQAFDTLVAPKNKPVLKFVTVQTLKCDHLLQFAGQIEKLGPFERQLLQNQVILQLAKERRRCNAGAASYDASRHIRLYLIEKALKPTAK
jgi:hypothetical protein